MYIILCALQSGKSLSFEDMPRSRIIYGSSQEESGNAFIMLKAKARQLYSRYIAMNGAMELNVSYQMRRDFAFLMEQHDHWMENEGFDDLEKLRDLFDDAFNEILNLLRDSFDRYKRCKTEEFKCIAERIKTPQTMSLTGFIGKGFGKIRNMTGRSDKNKQMETKLDFDA